MKIKVTFGVDTRVWRASEPTFSGLLAFVQDVWGESLPQQYRMSYTDTDGDNVTIASQMDLAESLQTASGDAQKQVRISVLGVDPSLRPVEIPDTMNDDDDTEYEIVRGGSPSQESQEVVSADQVLDQAEESPEDVPPVMSRDEEKTMDKEEEPKEKSQAHIWAEERINAGRVPTVEQLITNFQVTLDHANSIMATLAPGIQTLQALLGCEGEEPSRVEGQETPPEEPPRPKSPSEMCQDELKSMLLGMGFNIQGNEEALRLAVRALSNPNITVEATAYAEPNNAGQAPPPPCCTKDELIKEFFDCKEAQEELVSTFVDVVHSRFSEGEEAVVAIKTAVAACDHLSKLRLIEKFLPFLYQSDKLNNVLQAVMMFGPQALKSVLQNVLTAVRSHQLDGDQNAFQHPMFAMFKPFCKDIRKVVNEFTTSQAPDVRRDEQGRVIHMGVICDGCGMDPIHGVRWKSCARQDYDLCEHCEPKRADRHNPMIKYEYPAQSSTQGLPGLREATRKNRNRGNGSCPWKKGRCGGRWRRNMDTPSGPEHPHGGAQHPPFHPPFGFPFGPGRGRGCHWRGRGGRGRGRGGFFRNMFNGFNQMMNGWTGQNDQGNKASSESTENGIITTAVHEYHARNIENVAEVVEARYGNGNQMSDVTEKVKALCEDGTIKLTGVRSLNQHFGDPAVGQIKKLILKYKLGEAKPVETETDMYSITVDQRPMGFRYDGTQVTNVFPWGKAARAGMTAGSSIVMINGQDVDAESATPVYQTAVVPFQIVLSRQVPKSKKKLSPEEKLSKQEAKLEKKIQKTQKKMEQAEKKAAKQGKQLQKQSSKLKKQAANLQKQRAKLEAGKGGKKLVNQMAKNSIKLVNKSQHLQKRQGNHAKFVDRLERQKAKMQAKLLKMEAKLEAVNAKKEAMMVETSDIEISSSEEQEATVADHVEEAKEAEPEPQEEEPTAAELVFKVAVDHPYYEQNQALVSMGFVDERNNMHVLAQSDGNLPRAITMLVENASNDNL